MGLAELAGTETLGCHFCGGDFDDAQYGSIFWLSLDQVLPHWIDPRRDGRLFERRSGTGG
jgi:hypothetical protein